MPKLTQTPHTQLSLNLQTLMQLVGNTGGTEGTRAGAGSSLPRPRSPQAGLPPVALAIVATLVVGLMKVWSRFESFIPFILTFRRL